MTSSADQSQCPTEHYTQTDRQTDRQTAHRLYRYIIVIKYMIETNV